MPRWMETKSGDDRVEMEQGLPAGRGVGTLSLMKILVIEDEKKIASFVKKGLTEAGFTVDVEHNGDDGYRRATHESYDAIVLDIMLPGRDGLSILGSLRDKKNPVPVILLTARSELRERLDGLNQGADDYLTKPFYMEELIARLQAVTRRSGGEGLSLLQVEDLVINLLTRDVTRGETKVELTAREFNLLEYLVRSPGRVLTRTQILEHVWGYNFDPQTNLVDVYIQRVRKKIAPNGEDGLIETLRGVGYRCRKKGGA